jgi:hypothetical protein
MKTYLNLRLNLLRFPTLQIRDVNGLKIRLQFHSQAVYTFPAIGDGFREQDAADSLASLFMSVAFHCGELVIATALKRMNQIQLGTTITDLNSFHCVPHKVIFVFELSDVIQFAMSTFLISRIPDGFC